VSLIGTIEILNCLIKIVLVVLGKAVVEEDVNRIVDRQALQELLIFAEVKIAVQGCAVYFDLRIALARLLALGDGFFQHSAKPVGVAEFPMRLRVIRTISQNRSQYRNRLLRSSGIRQQVGGIDSRLNQSGIQRDCLLIGDLRLAIVFSTAELKRGSAGVRPSQMRP